MAIAFACFSELSSKSAVEEVQTEAPQPSTETQESEASTEAVEKGTAEEPTGDDDSEKRESEDKERRRQSVSDRISKKTQEANDAKARADAAEKRAELAEARVRELQGDEEELLPPELKDYGYDEDAYRKAYAEYNEKVAARALRANQVENERIAADEAQREMNQAIQERWESTQAEFEIDHPDYRQVVSNPNFVQAPHVAQGIMMAKNGAAVAYHLASNPELTHQLNSSNPVEALMQMGSLAERLSAPPPITTTSAPDPAPVVTPKGKAEKTLDDMSPEEYAKHRGYR